jgi:hypothetical protein
MITAAKKAYSSIRSLMPLQLRGFLSRALIDLRFKPTVNGGKRGFFKKGIAVFSADFEMAWAYRFSKSVSDAEAMARRERRQVPLLLELFAAHDIPVTWAAVGHLFLKECRKNEAGLAHGDLPRPRFFSNAHWRYESGDWYRHDPGTDAERDPCWYAPDLVRLIRKSHGRNEIACHTFSHIDFTYKNCPRELAIAELALCRRLAAEFGCVLTSMAFPAGTAGNYEALKETGFSCYRKESRFDIDVPEVDGLGLVSIPSGQQLERDAYGWSVAFHVKRFRKFVDRAVGSGELCAFWFHPSMDPWYIENVMPKILPIVDEARARGSLSVLTMGELARSVVSGELLH